MRKKSKLKENIKILEDLSINFKQSIEDLKKLFEKINEDKEKLKTTIQNIFTKLRNELNNREDKLLSDVDNKFDKLFLKEDIIKQGDKLPNIIKNSLIRGKLIEEHWNENKLNSLINDCLNIEYNIENINKINEIIRKNNSANISFKFYPAEKDISEFLEKIKSFGNIEDSNYKPNPQSPIIKNII